MWSVHVEGTSFATVPCFGLTVYWDNRVMLSMVSFSTLFREPAAFGPAVLLRQWGFGSLGGVLSRWNGRKRYMQRLHGIVGTSRGEAVCVRAVGR